MTVRSFLADRLPLRVKRRIGALAIALLGGNLPGSLRAPLIARVGRGAWTLEAIQTHRDGSLTVMGWVARSDPSSPFAVVVNRRRCDKVTTFRRPQLRSLFPSLPRAGRLGFHAHARIVPVGEPIEIDVIEEATGEPLGRGQRVFATYDRPERFPLPEPSRLAALRQGTDLHAFCLSGYSNIWKIDRALRDVGSRPLYSFPRILEWGCGLGRHLRYLADLPHVHLTAADAHSDDLAWCRQHLPVADYVALANGQRSALPDTAFDLVIALSAPRLLTRAEQTEWLGETARVTASGGFVITAIEGGLAQAMRLNPWSCRQIDRQGFIDRVGNGVSFHAPAYVRREWGRVFDVLDVVPACIDNMQDLIVMRKR